MKPGDRVRVTRKCEFYDAEGVLQREYPLLKGNAWWVLLETHGYELAFWEDNLSLIVPLWEVVE